jgi:uncharacterized membrane protein (UPF0127 family)
MERSSSQLYISPVMKLSHMLTRGRNISFQGHIYPTLIASEQHDINVGMGAFDIPPPYAMIFMLRGNYSTFTMNGVNFPLHVAFYDRNFRLLESFTAIPGMRNRANPQGAYYMVEVPL